MGARTREFDWDATPLGPPATWPQALRSALRICLHSSFPTAIYWGPELRLLYNDAWAPIPAEKHPWALGRPAREVWADIWDVIEPQMMQVIASGHGFSTFDQMLPMERGGKIQETYWNYSLTPILNEDGSVAGLFNQGHDTTAQIMARREREAELARLRVMFDQAPGAIALVTGPNHVFDVANAAYLRLIDRDNIVGKSVADALPEVIDQGFVTLLDRVYRSGERYIGHNVPVQLKRVSHVGFEERLLDFIYEPMRSGSGEVTGIFIQATDVTERARAEAQLQALNITLEQRVIQEVARRSEAEQTLRQVQKLEALGQLTGGIAHDFNNMLAVVISGLTLLRRRLDRGETSVEPYINGAIEGAQRAAALTQRLLAFARQQPLNPEFIDVNQMMVEMTEVFERTLGEDIRIETSFGRALWTIRADRNQLENALLNIAVNARDAMANGGQLRIETANATIDDDTAQQLNLSPGQFVRLCVADDGCGMSPEVKAQAFDPFFTTKPVGSGTGLGLSQVLGFVTQSGGQVDIKSELGRGTSIIIYLPAVEACPLTATSTPDDPKLSGLGGEPHEVILVVEDEARVRAFTVETLKELGYTVIAAANGDEALQIIEQGTQVSLLFTDMVMPGMTGRQLAAAALAHLPQLKIVYTSGYSRDTSAGAGAFEAGGNILRKPFRIEELASHIRTALRERR